MAHFERALHLVSLIIPNPYRVKEGRPQVWKTVPVEVLLRADPSFIKGFIVRFPTGTAVQTD